MTSPFIRDSIYEDSHRQKWRVLATDGPNKAYPLLCVRLSDNFQTAFTPTGERLAGHGITWMLNLKSKSTGDETP